MLPVFLDCPFLVAPSVFNVSVFCVVFFALFSFVLCLVYPMLPVFLECSFLIAPSVFSDVYLFCLLSSCVLCTQCCQFFWSVHSWLPLLFSLTFICFVCFRPVSCVPNVASFSGMFILDCPFCFLWRLFVLFAFVLCLVYPMLPVFLECSFLIAPSVFSDVYLFCLLSSCVLCTQCCQFFWNVHSWLPLLFSLTFICFVCFRPVSCVPNVASFSGLFILDCPSVFSNVYWFYLVEQIWRKRFECEIVNKDRRTGNKWY